MCLLGVDYRQGSASSDGPPRAALPGRGGLCGPDAERICGPGQRPAAAAHPQAGGLLPHGHRERRLHGCARALNLPDPPGRLWLHRPHRCRYQCALLVSLSSLTHLDASGCIDLTDAGNRTQAIERPDPILVWSKVNSRLPKPLSSLTYQVMCVALDKRGLRASHSIAAWSRYQL